MIELNKRSEINIRDKKITVVGLGISGTQVAKLANHLGARVFGTDLNSNNEVLINSMDLMHDYHIASEIGLHSDQIFEADLWILSPGISKNEKIVKIAIKKNIPIVSEIEFSSWFTESTIIAITGSNGKTTTSHILYEICKRNKFNVRIAGNMGLSFSECVLDEIINPDDNRVYILEISSFQMEFVRHFSPKISIFTNISPDHLDRHGSMTEYLNMKLKMVQNIKPDASIIYNCDIPMLATALKNKKANLIPFSINGKNTLFKIRNNKIKGPLDDSILRLNELKILGDHNLHNSLLASTCAHLLGINDNIIFKTIKEFKGIEHRLEYVISNNSIDYINDSKATNIDAVIAAIKTFNKPIILILGGYNKGSDFRLLLPHIKSSHVREIISYGEAGEQINTAIGDAVRLIQVTNLSSAVQKAQVLAIPGDIVLFSPGCASFDEFSNFEVRGQHFKKLVNEFITK